MNNININNLFIWVLSTTFCAATLTGCAIDDKGFVAVKHFENKTVHMVKLKSLGFFISTKKADAGLSIGFTERSYFYPKDSEFSQFDLNHILNTIEDDQFEPKPELEAVDNLLIPFAWINHTNGLSINSNADKVGLSLGINKGYRIQLPQNFNGVLIFKHSSSGENNILYMQNKPLQ